MQKLSTAICVLAIIASTGTAGRAALAHEATNGTMPNDMQGGAAHHDAETSFGKPGDPKKATRTVTITATEIAFDVKDMTFRKGETVRFVLVNKGEQPHELTIADEAEQMEHRKMMQQMAGMDMASMGHNDPNTVSADPGETKELVWTFTRTGTFEFACNYPGHAEVGMTGKITVK